MVHVSSLLVARWQLILQINSKLSRAFVVDTVVASGFCNFVFYHWKEIMVGIMKFWFTSSPTVTISAHYSRSKQVIGTKSGMVSTPHILMRQGVNYAKSHEIMRRNQKICELANTCEAPFYARLASSHAKNYAPTPLRKYGKFYRKIGSLHYFVLLKKGANGCP